MSKHALLMITVAMCAVPLLGQTSATVVVWGDAPPSRSIIVQGMFPQDDNVQPKPGGGDDYATTGPEQPAPRGFRMVQDWRPTQDHRFLAGGSWDNYSFVDPLPGCGIGLGSTVQSSWEGSLAVAEFGVKVGYQESVTLTWTTGVTVSPRRHGELLLYGVMWNCKFEDVRLLGTVRGSASQAKSIHSVYADRPVSAN